MAQAVSIKFGRQAILVGDGADPEVFGAPCGITSLSRNTNPSSTDTVEPDCDDVDAMAWTKTDIHTKQMRVSGSGLLDENYLPTWDQWDMDGSEKNVRWKRPGGYYEGPAVLVSYSENGERGGRWNVDFEIAFNGKPVWTAE